jgi:hypothetical protein
LVYRNIEYGWRIRDPISVKQRIKYSKVPAKNRVSKLLCLRMPCTNLKQAQAQRDGDGTYKRLRRAQAVSDIGIEDQLNFTLVTLSL